MRSSPALVGSATLLVFLGCAHPVPPTGGPEDRSPPEIAWTSPRLYETGVATDAPLRIVFNERMDRGSVEDGLLIRPQRDLARVEWREDTLLATPRDGWRPETSYTVLLKRAVRDQRDNTLVESSLLVFSTGDSVARGRVAGRVERIGVSSAPVLVLGFSSVSSDTTAIDPLQAISVAEPNDDGRFLLPGLEPGTAYEIGAFLDVNENRAFDSKTDLYCRAVAPVVPDTAGGPQDVHIVLVFADEPGSIQGVAADSVCDAHALVRVAAAARADSMTAYRDSLLSVKAHTRARADSLTAEVVAPSGEGPDPDRLRVITDSLRVIADSLRAHADSVSVPDSTQIAAALRLSPAALADSTYCAIPVIARFWSVAEPESLKQETTYGGAYGVSRLAPGTYDGLVWRDLDGDGEYQFSDEPGVDDTVHVYVPPGRAAVVDTVRLVRPGDWRPQPSDP
jgi:hypothetical protein